MNKNNNSTNKMVDKKTSYDSRIKGKLLRTFNTMNLIRWHTGSQCTANRTGVMWADLLVRVTMRAAAF